MAIKESEIEYLLREHEYKTDIINKRAKQIQKLKWKNKLKQLLKRQKQ